MRIGVNPAKKDFVEVDDVYHRIIIPVYIPNLEGYFKESLAVLKLCLNSLYSTIHSKTRISVASNGCCKEVNDFLKHEFVDNRIDELYLIKSSIGKINSLYKILNSVKEPIITITDADVLFSNGWQEAVEKIFIDYPKSGMVSPFSNTKGFRQLTANIYFDNLLNNNIKVSEVKDPEALTHFAKSINNEEFYKEIHKNKSIIYQKKGKTKAIIGAAHFVASYKRDVFDLYKYQSNLKKLSSGEQKFLDTPPVSKGLWKLSTYRNYVYHMGNTQAQMYKDVLKENKNGISTDILQKVNVKKTNPILYMLKNKFFARLLFSNNFFHFYMRRFGFTRNEAKEYLK